MSLVTTAMSSSPASCSHNVPMMVLLPVPTGPTMPSRMGRCAGLRESSGNENPPCPGGVEQRPLLDVRCGQRREFGARPGVRCCCHQLLDRVARVDDPGGGVQRINGKQLECCRGDGLRILVQPRSRSLRIFQSQCCSERTENDRALWPRAELRQRGNGGIVTTNTFRESAQSTADHSGGLPQRSGRCSGEQRLVYRTQLHRSSASSTCCQHDGTGLHQSYGA